MTNVSDMSRLIEKVDFWQGTGNKDGYGSPEDRSKAWGYDKNGELLFSAEYDENDNFRLSLFSGEPGKIKICEDFDNAFAKCDVLIAPTVPNTAFPLNYTCDNVIEMYLSDICTVPINIAHLPAISIPCGKDKNNLPIGMQIIGNKKQEQTILNTAYYFEKNSDIAKNL